MRSKKRASLVRGPGNLLGKILTATTALMLLTVGIMLMPGGKLGTAAAVVQQAQKVQVQPGQSATADRYGVCQSWIKRHDAATMDRELSEMNAAGIKWLRVELPWFEVEPLPGMWNFAQDDLVVSKAQEQGINLLVILMSGPIWANTGPFPNFPPANMEAWRNYVRTLCSRYRGRVAAYEVWNEENIHAFWWPAPDLNAYVNLLKETAPVVREADPAARVVMGGVAGADKNFLSRCFEAGVSDYVDAVAYHPYAITLFYGNLAPLEDECRRMVAYVRDLINTHAARPMEIWLTELGWTTGGFTAVDQETQSSYQMRTFINYADLGVDKVFWYNLWDEEDNPDNMEANWGLIANDFTRKEAFYSYKTFQETFGCAVRPNPSAATVEPCSLPLEAHSFEMPDGTLITGVWRSDDSSGRINITLNNPRYASCVTVDPLTGQERPVPGVSRTSDGRMHIADISVGKRPVILKSRTAASPVKPYVKYRSATSPAAPLINSVSSNGGLEGDTITVELAGTEFAGGAVVSLERGDSTVAATNVNVVSSTKITCRFDLHEGEAGCYDVVLRNTTGQEGRLAGGFEVGPMHGAGGAPAVSAFVLALGFIAVAGLGLMGIKLRGRIK